MNNETEINASTLSMINDEQAQGEISDSSNNSAFNSLSEKIKPFYDSNPNLENYGISAEEQSKIKTEFQRLSLIDRLRLKFMHLKLDCLSYPTIKDDENYIFTKKTTTNSQIYFYCREYPKCHAFLKVGINGNSVKVTIKFYFEN